MAKIRVTADGPVHAPPSFVYGLIADYRRHHPRFLPAAFSDLTVEQGGVGAGTVFTFRLRLAGRNNFSRVTVTEPEPGRVLQESDGKITTLFYVDPESDYSRVRFDTVYESRGLASLVERFLVPALLKPLYRDELARLDDYARRQSQQAADSTQSGDERTAAEYTQAR